MSAVLAIASPRRIKATHRRRRKVTAGHFVQRYYDPALGAFLSPDPMAVNTKTAWNFGRYDYAGNNPYRFTDPDGRVMSAKDADDQKSLLGWINARSATQFKFKANGQLAIDRSKQKNQNGSKTFAGQLIAGIRAAGKIEMDITPTMTGTAASPNAPLVLSDAGNGYTQDRKQSPGLISVGVNGLPFNVDGVKGTMTMSGGDILMHELLAHAIPQLLGDRHGNGIERDNAARSELNLELRAPDAGHCITEPCE